MTDPVVTNPHLGKAKEHFSGAALRKIPVEEWGIDIHYRDRISVRQRETVYTLPDGKSATGFRALARAVMLLSLDVRGERMFSEMDMHALMYEVDGDVVSRIGARLIAATGQDRTPDQQVDDQKNV